MLARKTDDRDARSRQDTKRTQWPRYLFWRVAPETLPSLRPLHYVLSFKSGDACAMRAQQSATTAEDRSPFISMRREDLNTSVVVEIDDENVSSVELTSSTHGSGVAAPRKTRVPSLAVPAGGAGESANSQRSHRSARATAGALSARLLKTPRALAKGAMHILNESADAVLEIIDGPAPETKVPTLSDEKIDRMVKEVLSERAAKQSARGRPTQELEA